MSYFPKLRLRRLRQNETIRRLVRENHLDLSKIVHPLFIKHGKNINHPIPSMPGQFQLSIDLLPKEIEELVSLGIKSVLLFGIPKEKDDVGSHAYTDEGVIQQAIKTIKSIAPELLVITDVCFCEYMDHGHCGVLIENQHTHCAEINVDNDATLELLVKQSLSHAKAGADIIAPSGNMDGMVHALREALDKSGFTHTPILSYAVKYASAMYGPFRDAAEGKPQFGDRQTYQMDIANGNEALRECELDIAEGADMIMVKPAHTYLDVMWRVKQKYPQLPLCAYHTSGEYAMLKAASLNGWIDEKKSVLEVLTAIRRAGADFIITYFAKDLARWLV